MSSGPMSITCTKCEGSFPLVMVEERPGYQRWEMKQHECNEDPQLNAIRDLLADILFEIKEMRASS